MDHAITRIYAMLVCFVSIVCITITTGVALYNLVSLTAPELTISPYRYEHLQTGDFPGGRPGAIMNPRSELIAPRAEPLSEAELAEFRDRQMQIMLESERRSAVSSLIRLAIILIVTIPLYYVHWRLAQKYEISTQE